MIYGRRPRQLLVVWGFSLLLIILLYWLEINAPALHDLLLPFYWIVFFVALFLTWRWLRARSPRDRRGRDRRHADRRGQSASDTSVDHPEKEVEERL
jgi:membrane protein implicated in regulation of membrane protease activity